MIDKLYSNILNTCMGVPFSHMYGFIRRPWASVATAIADVFRKKNAISMGNKFTEMLQIFYKIDEMKSWGVIEEAEMIGVLFSELLMISRLTLTGQGLSANR